MSKSTKVTEREQLVIRLRFFRLVLVIRTPVYREV